MAIWASERVQATPGTLGLTNDESLEVVVSELDFAPTALAVAATLLSPEEQQRARRFVFERERNQFIATRAKLRQLLGARIGVRPEFVELVYGKYGKPALDPRLTAQALHFNLSRSHDMAVFAFVSGRQIGIDIEFVRPIVTADHIATQFFSAGEQTAFRSLATEDRTLAFFNAWTRKEAFIKALGEGLHHPLDTFDVSLTPEEPARIYRVGMSNGTDCGWRLHSFRPGPGFVGAIVVQEESAGEVRRQSDRMH